MLTDSGQERAFRWDVRGELGPDAVSDETDDQSGPPTEKRNRARAEPSPTASPSGRITNPNTGVIHGHDPASIRRRGRYPRCVG